MEYEKVERHQLAILTTCPDCDDELCEDCGACPRCDRYQDSCGSCVSYEVTE